MDRKTLEYMADRVDKAKKIIRRIEELTKSAERVIDIREFSTRDIHTNHLFSIHGDQHPELLQTLRQGLMKMITDEIARLEQELAEL